MLRLLVVLILVLGGTLQAQTVASLMPPPKTAFGYADTARFRLSAASILVLPDTLSDAMRMAVQRLDNELQRRFGLQLTHLSIHYFLLSMPPYQSAIVLLPDTDPDAPSFLPTLFEHGENPPARDGGYVLDIRQTQAVLYCHASVDGGANAIASFLQLVRTSDVSCPQSHVWDEPDYPNRWVFSLHNMLVNSNIQVLRAIADTMATYKLNGIQQNDFKLGILDRMQPTYFNNVDSLKKIWAERNVEVIPGVCGIGWSSTLMYQYSQLAEGIEARAKYVFEADSGRLVPHPKAVIPNGGFENVDGQGKFSNYNYYDTCFHQDKSVYHSGTASAKATNMPANSNARFNRVLDLQPHQYYNLSVWMKTQDCSADEFRVMVLADTGNSKYRAITFSSLDISTNSDWTKVEVFFNTLEYSSVVIYAGIWGAHGGTLWLDDFSIKPAGLCNVLRRKGTPLVAQSVDASKTYTEGQDFLPINDPWWDTPTESIGPYHTPPRFQRTASSSIQNGDTVELSYYHPFAAVSDNKGNGSIMVCVSEDTLYSLLDKQISSVNSLFQAKKYFMGHDEIRNMNRDAACLNRHMSPAQLLAENMHKCDSLISKSAPASRRFMWSDMLDSLHNAVNNYYLINGDLRGVWDLAPKSITMMNWNAGKMNPSLEFFARKGYKQMTAPFFTAGSSNGALNWRIAQDDVSELQGMMYTTWTNEYRYLKNFAYYSWGAGPYVQHRPLDSTCFADTTADVIATITGDPFDVNDAITGVEMVIHKTSLSQVQRTIAMTKTGSTQWTLKFRVPAVDWFRYSIRARNKQGFLREIPTYLVKRAGSDTVTSVAIEEQYGDWKLQPQPAREQLLCSFHCAPNEMWHVDIHDMLGRVVRSETGFSASLSFQTLNLDCAALPSGVYSMRLQRGQTLSVKSFVVQHD